MVVRQADTTSVEPSRVATRQMHHKKRRTGQPPVGARVDVADVLRDRVLVRDGRGLVAQVLVDGRDDL